MEKSHGNPALSIKVTLIFHLSKDIHTKWTEGRREGEKRKDGRAKAEEDKGERQERDTHMGRAAKRSFSTKNKKRGTLTRPYSRFYLGLLLNKATNKHFFHFYLTTLQRTRKDKGCPS